MSFVAMFASSLTKCVMFSWPLFKCFLTRWIQETHREATLSKKTQQKYKVEFVFIKTWISQRYEWTLWVFNKILWFFKTNPCLWCMHSVLINFRFTLATFVLNYFFFIQGTMNWKQCSSLSTQFTIFQKIFVKVEHWKKKRKKKRHVQIDRYHPL